MLALHRRRMESIDQIDRLGERVHAVIGSLAWPSRYGPLAHGPAGPARANNVAQQPKAGLAFSR
jgi:hypothetical protein